MTSETNLIQGDENNAIQCKSKTGGEMFYYTAEVRDEKITPKLKQVIADMAKLKKEHDDLVKELSLKAARPSGWGVNVRRVFEYGYIEVEITKSVYRVDTPEKPKPVYVAPIIPEPTKLDKLLRNIDAKTLFNSGILTKEEKRELLGL